MKTRIYVDSIEKKFDAVAMMRSAREKISTVIEGMTLEEELQWLAAQDLADPFLKRLRDRAAAPVGALGGTRRRG
jgi:hypothetical protein